MNKIPVSKYTHKRITKGQSGPTIKEYRKHRKLKRKMAKRTSHKR